jgi:hypothetical protein
MPVKINKFKRTYTREELDLGYEGYVDPDFVPGNGGIIYGSLESYARKHDGDSSDAVHIDTRPTIKEVRDELNRRFGYDWNSDSDQSNRVWQEYMHVGHEHRANDKWPDNYRWIAVYVVQGGSEGYYLHIDVVYCEGNRELMILGKTLHCGLEEAYESAKQIALFLGV